jgi:hypothetical protein
MTGFHIESDAIRKPTVFDDSSFLRPVGIHRMNEAGVYLKDEKAASRAFAAGPGFRFRIRCQSVSHFVLLSQLCLDPAVRAVRSCRNRK